MNKELLKEYSDGIKTAIEFREEKLSGQTISSLSYLENSRTVPFVSFTNLDFGEKSRISYSDSFYKNVVNYEYTPVGFFTALQKTTTKRVLVPKRIKLCLNENATESKIIFNACSTLGMIISDKITFPQQVNYHTPIRSFSNFSISFALELMFPTYLLNSIEAKNIKKFYKKVKKINNLGFNEELIADKLKINQLLSDYHS